jgi:hypothetical protein
MTNQSESSDSDSGKAFEVEKIIGFRTLKGKEQYHMKWKGYKNSWNTWEDAGSNA